LKRKIQKKIHFKSGFSLAEMVIVVAILLLLFTLSMRGIVNSQQSFIFNNSAEHVIQMVREARSLAVTGKAQADFTDADKDNAASVDMGDFVTPAHYGIYFDTTKNKVVLFIDVNRGESSNQNEGKYDAPSAVTGIGEFEDGKDVELEEFQLDSSMSFILNPATTKTVMFSPIFADTSFDPALSGTQFFVFGVKDVKGIARSRCYKIHLIAGVPEVADSTDATGC